MWNSSSRKGKGYIWWIRYKENLLACKTKWWTFRPATLKCSKGIRNMPVSSFILTFSWFLSSFCKKALSMRHNVAFNDPIFIPFYVHIPVEKDFSFPVWVLNPGKDMIGPRWVKYSLGPSLVARRVNNPKPCDLGQGPYCADFYLIACRTTGNGARKFLQRA